MKFSRSDQLKDDKSQILKLNKKIYGDVEISNPDFFDWQYLNNPEGEAIVITAKDDEQENTIIGVESILPMNIMVNQNIVRASLTCNSCVHPDHRNKGIFSELLSTVLKESIKNEILCICGVTNNNSFNAFVKKGAHEISDLPILFRPLRLSNYFSFPLNFILNLFDDVWKIKKNIIQDVTLFDGNFDESFEILAKKASKRISIIKHRTKEYLNWRYRNHPTREYIIYVLKENSILKGYVIIRKADVNGRLVGVIVDFLVDPDQRIEKIEGLLKTALNHLWNSKVSVVITTSGPMTLEYEILRHAGFRVAPKFIKPPAHFLLINSEPNRNDLESMKQYDNWFFSFGDYDVF